MITGYEGGSFSLIVQDAVATDSFSSASTNSEIASGLNAASAQLPSTARECSSYTITKTTANGGKNIYIRVQFNVDNARPLTLLDVFSSDIIGRLKSYFNISI